MSETSSESWIKSLFPFVVMCFGGFMALLDIQIVASSLQYIGGGLSVAQDEISWVQTAYLIAEIIVIPLSGWLTRVFSTRWLFTGSAAGFTATSMLCGPSSPLQPRRPRSCSPARRHLHRFQRARSAFIPKVASRAPSHCPSMARLGR
jgi:MFS family permease